MTNLIRLLKELELEAMKMITERPATFHAIGLALKIAGWEEAHRLGDDSFRLDRKIQQILEEKLINMRGY